jgi:hypothetical protein
MPSVEQSLLLSVRAVPRSTDLIKATLVHHQVLLRSLQLVVVVVATGATKVALSQLTQLHQDLKFLEPVVVVAAVAAADCRTLLVVKSLRKHCHLVQCRTATAEAMQSLVQTFTVLVVVVLAKQVPIAQHHQCFPQPVVSAEPRTSLVTLCIPQQVEAAQVDTPITGLQVAKVAVETVAV